MATRRVGVGPGVKMDSQSSWKKEAMVADVYATAVVGCGVLMWEVCSCDDPVGR